MNLSSARGSRSGGRAITVTTLAVVVGAAVAGTAVSAEAATGTHRAGQQITTAAELTAAIEAGIGRETNRPDFAPAGPIGAC